MLILLSFKKGEWVSWRVGVLIGLRHMTIIKLHCNYNCADVMVINRRVVTEPSPQRCGNKPGNGMRFYVSESGTDESYISQ